MVRKILFSALMAGTLSASAAREHSYNIIPEPVEIIEAQGEFMLESHIPLYVDDESLTFSATYLVDYAERYLGLPIEFDTVGAGKRKNRKKVEQEENRIRLALNSSYDKAGAYCLRIEPEVGITIEGAEEGNVVGTTTTRTDVASNVVPNLIMMVIFILVVIFFSRRGIFFIGGFGGGHFGGRRLIWWRRFLWRRRIFRWRRIIKKFLK